MGVPVVGVIIHGGSVCFAPDTLASMDALLDGWFPGMRGGAALADALVGAYSPAGRSPGERHARSPPLPGRPPMHPQPASSKA